MDEIRLIDANNLKFILKLGVEQGTIKTMSDVEDFIDEMTVFDKEALYQRWKNPDADPPKVETEVLILYLDEIGGYEITTAQYEDGNVLSEDSEWNWTDLCDWGEYDEEHDDYLIPKGWWEYRHFNSEEVYNNKIDCPVVGWMPLPKKPAGVNGENNGKSL